MNKTSLRCKRGAPPRRTPFARPFLNQDRRDAMFRADRIRWPEMVQYCFESGGHELQIFRWNPSAAEISAIDAGAVKVAFSDHGSVCSFELELTPGGEKLRGPVAWWLLQAREGALPPLSSPVRLTLIDGACGVVRAIGYIEFPKQVEATLMRRLRQQSQQPLGHLKMDEALKKLACSA